MDISVRHLARKQGKEALCLGQGGPLSQSPPPSFAAQIVSESAPPLRPAVCKGAYAGPVGLGLPPRHDPGRRAAVGHRALSPSCRGGPMVGWWGAVRPALGTPLGLSCCLSRRPEGGLTAALPPPAAGTPAVADTCDRCLLAGCRPATGPTAP